eukprot:363525-Chlamydomonas_euryale.AAC.4
MGDGGELLQKGSCGERAVRAGATLSGLCGTFASTPPGRCACPSGARQGVRGVSGGVHALRADAAFTGTNKVPPRALHVRVKRIAASREHGRAVSEKQSNRG